MKHFILAALVALPSAAFGQKLNAADLEESQAAKLEDAGLPPPARPNPEKIMAEISTALRLSSKQEDRISVAVKKKAAEFDKVQKEYDKNNGEEKKWRYKTNESRHQLVKLTRDLPDTVREFLDDEQREAYDAMLAEGAAARKAAAAPAPAAGEEQPAPAKKRKLVKRKKAPAPEAGPAAEAGEEGGVMVDKEGGKAGPKKKKILVKRKAPKAAAEPAAEEAPAAGEPPAEEGKQEAPAEEDAGSYP